MATTAAVSSCLAVIRTGTDIAMGIATVMDMVMDMVMVTATDP